MLGKNAGLARSATYRKQELFSDGMNIHFRF